MIEAARQPKLLGRTLEAWIVPGVPEGAATGGSGRAPPRLDRARRPSPWGRRLPASQGTRHLEGNGRPDRRPPRTGHGAGARRFTCAGPCAFKEVLPSSEAWMTLRHLMEPHQFDAVGRAAHRQALQIMPAYRSWHLSEDEQVRKVVICDSSRRASEAWGIPSSTLSKMTARSRSDGRVSPRATEPISRIRATPGLSAMVARRNVGTALRPTPDETSLCG